MSRTREYEVFLSDTDFRELSSIQHCLIDISTNYRSEKRIKAKLIIELPERKVTISESEFMKIWDNTKTFSDFKEIKDRLFKDA